MNNSSSTSTQVAPRLKYKATLDVSGYQAQLRRVGLIYMPLHCNERPSTVGTGLDSSTTPDPNPKPY